MFSWKGKRNCHVREIGCSLVRRRENGVHLVYIERVGGSNPSSPTNSPNARDEISERQSYWPACTGPAALSLFGTGARREPAMAAPGLRLRAAAPLLDTSGALL